MSTGGAEDPYEIEDAKTLINLGRTGVYLTALEGDVRTLMRTFQRLQAYDFGTFCEVWKLMNFSLIHFASTEKNSRLNFMRTLYRTVLSHMQPGAIIEIRIGVVYALYLLYYTQPVNFPNIKVRVDMDTWKLIAALYAYCKESDIKDVNYVIDRMHKDGAFEFVAWIDDNEGVLYLEGDDSAGAKAAKHLAQIEHEVMASAQGNVADPKASKRQLNIAQEYLETKRRIINHPLVAQATRRLYASEFGGSASADTTDAITAASSSAMPADELPYAIPLDVSDKDLSWWSGNLTRVREYQRTRAERVGAVAEDDGSLRMLADYSYANSRTSTPSSTNTPGQSRRLELNQSEYDKQNRQYVPDAIKAIMRANKHHG